MLLVNWCEWIITQFFDENALKMIYLLLNCCYTHGMDSCVRKRWSQDRQATTCKFSAQQDWQRGGKWRRGSEMRAAASIIQEDGGQVAAQWTGSSNFNLFLQPGFFQLSQQATFFVRMRSIDYKQVSWWLKADKEGNSLFISLKGAVYRVKRIIAKNNEPVLHWMNKRYRRVSRNVNYGKKILFSSQWRCL